jgi:hypothetical protein
MNDDEAVTGPDEPAARIRLAQLRVEHEDLDAAIEALEARPSPDQIRIARFKKKKLAVRDEMARLEDLITPDIIA